MENLKIDFGPVPIWDGMLMRSLQDVDQMLSELQREPDPQNPTRWRHRPGMDPKVTAQLRFAIRDFLEEFRKATPCL